MKDELTIEQSQQLIELGISEESASLGYVDEELKSHPIFTLVDLLDILPKAIKKEGTTYKLNIDYPPIEQVAARYNTEYDELESLAGVMCDTLTDALFHLTKWCIKNNHIKTK